jgi:hypothetical protein
MATGLWEYQIAQRKHGEHAFILRNGHGSKYSCDLLITHEKFPPELQTTIR